jgi:hypothetical protein
MTSQELSPELILSPLSPWPANHEIEDTEFAKRWELLKKLPVIDTNDLFYFHDYATGSTHRIGLSEVEIAKIIAAPNLANWTELKQDRILMYAKTLSSGSNRLTNQRDDAVQIVEYGGAYAIHDNGRHRVATHMLLGWKNVPVRLFRRETTHVWVDSIESFEELLKREKAGLLKLSEYDYEFLENMKVNSVTIKVDAYQAAWVFAKNMDLAKKLYFQTQAHGKFLRDIA